MHVNLHTTNVSCFNIGYSHTTNAHEIKITHPNKQQQTQPQQPQLNTTSTKFLQKAAEEAKSSYQLQQQSYQ